MTTSSVSLSLLAVFSLGAHSRGGGELDYSLIYPEGDGERVVCIPKLIIQQVQGLLLLGGTVHILGEVGQCFIHINMVKVT